MTTNTTKPYRNTLSGSVGAGMGSLFNPSGRKYYILEHKIGSKYHRVGESQEIIVDNIELGRDPLCQVRYDESFKTVSRHHAAIVRDGDNWKLVQISKTNTTLLNGHPVRTEWYLQNGDEIQLSINGPKLGFIIPSGNKSTVGSIGLSRRLSLFRQQALRPYKYALTTLACILILCSCGGSYVIYQQGKKLDDQTNAIREANIKNKQNERLIAELRKIADNQNGVLDSLYIEVERANKKAIEANKKAAEAREAVERSQTGMGGNVDLSSCHPYVYFISATSYVDGKKFIGWSGTGFLLDDGKFVTARHVTTPYYSNAYSIDKHGIVHVRSGQDAYLAYCELLLNVKYMMGEAEIRYKVSSISDSFEFTDKYIHQESSQDKVITLGEAFTIVLKDEAGESTNTLSIPAGTNITIGASGYFDWAWAKVNKQTGLKANTDLSVRLKQGTPLYIVGYPHGWGQGNPILSTAICSQDGLSKELGGTIMASNDNTEGGNSGGPIFVKGESGWEVVAIVSGGTYGKGRFVPIAVIQ